MFSSRSLRVAAAGVLGAGTVGGALLFGGAALAQADPGPASSTTFASAGPQSGPGFIPDRPGGHGWGGHDGRGHGNWGHGGWDNGWGRGGGYWGPQHWWNWWW